MNTIENNDVLVTKGVAGLGNRLLCLLGSIMYCHMTKRKLCIDWSDHFYSEDRENVFPSFFACKTEQIDISQVGDKDVYPPIWNGNLHKFVDELIRTCDPKYSDAEMSVHSKYSILLNEFNLKHKTLVRWSYSDDFSRIFKQLGYTFYSYKRRLQVLKRILAENITLVEAFSSELTKFSTNLLGQETIGVHIRLTDVQCPYKLLLDKLRKLASERKHAKIFLATDNRRVELEIERMFPGRVKRLDKLMPNDGTSIFSKDDFRSKQALKEALLDMYLLSLCDYLIFSSVSSFGLCSALLSQASKENISDCLSLKQRLKRAFKTAVINFAPKIYLRDR